MVTNEEIPDHRLIQATIKRAEILQEMGKTNEAMDEFKITYDASPSLAADPYAKALFQRGQEREAVGDLGGALADYGVALEVAPEGELKNDIFGKINRLENPQPEQPSTCPSCGREMDSKWDNCPYCGATINSLALNSDKQLDSTPVKPHKNRLTKRPSQKPIFIVFLIALLLFVLIILSISLNNRREASVAATEAATSTFRAGQTSTVQSNNRSTAETKKKATSAFRTEAHSNQRTQIAIENQARFATNKMKQSANKICKGDGDPGAANYSRSIAIHPFIFYPDKGYRYPKGHTKKLSELELVACIEETEKIINTQQYIGVDVGGRFTCTEKIKTVEITVRAAKTGDIIYKTVINGPKPELSCKDIETFLDQKKSKEYVGGGVHPNLLWEEIKDYVNPY